MEILAQSSTAFVLTHNFQGTHILGASRGYLSDSVASCFNYAPLNFLAYSHTCCWFDVGYVSWRNANKGSWFIRALSEELGKSLSSPEDVDFAHLLTRVTRSVAYEFESNGRKKQVPSVYSTLTKEIHFPSSAQA